MPREEELKAALEMIPINIIRNIIDEREINITSRRSDELIDALLAVDWTDADFENLKHRLARIQKEQNPQSRYIAKIDVIDPGLGESGDVERVVQIFQMNENEFDDENNLVEEGFEIIDYSNNHLEGIHWTESINYTLSPLNEIKMIQTLYQTGFEFDFDDRVLFIDCNLPAKATHLLRQLDDYGIRTEDVGHEILPNRTANEYIQQFVDELKEELEGRNTQSSIGDGRMLLEIDLVNMLLDEADLRDIKIGGRTDIMENPEVQRFREEHDSRIVRLEGEFNLNETWFQFKTGYTEGMGYVSVKKKGRVQERPELVDEAFEFLYEIYYNYFINV